MSDRGTQLDVLLLRDMVEEQRYSMERFADELERALGAHRGLIARSTTIKPAFPSAAGVGARLDSYAARFVRYPLAARRQRADVFHVVDQGYGHVAALLPKHRTVVTCHDLMLLRAAEDDAGFRPPLHTLVRFRASVRYLRSVARVVCDSEATRRDVVRLLGVPEERLRVARLGVQASFRPLSDDHRVGIRERVSPSRHLVLHVATGDAYKNVPATLRIVHALRNEGFDVTLGRVGLPLVGDEARLAKQLELDGGVVEFGRVSDDRLVELYNAADLLLFPSFVEGYGLPPLEAMACGTPVVASTAPSIVEIVGDAALVESATNVSALTRAARAVLTSEDLATTLRRRGRARAAQFTWSRTAALYADVYAELADAVERSVSPKEQRCAA